MESELGVGGVACFQLESESVFKTAGVESESVFNTAGVGVGFSKLLESESENLLSINFCVVNCTFQSS